MRLAILSDIHGNLPALEAVHADIQRQSVDEVLVAGDLVGRGPQGSAVVQYVRAQNWPTLKGNHEDYLLDFRHRRVPEEWWQLDQWSASRWLAAELNDDDAAFIEALPFSIQRPGLEVVHGTPMSNRHGIGSWTDDSTLRRHVAGLDANLLVCAHTHRPLIRTVDDTTVVNIGSVGLPFNRDPRAQYGLFTSSEGALQGAHQDGAWQVELRQVDYDRQLIFDVYRRSGFLEAGGVTARLLHMELEHATPILVPFLSWAEASHVSPSPEQLERFLQVFEPGQSLRQFMLDMQAQFGQSKGS